MLSAARGWQSEKLLELRTNCCSHTVCVAAQGDDLCMCALSRLVFALLLLTETLYLPSSFLAVCAQAALDGLWSERTDALQTRSHTLCHFAKRTKKQLEKKKSFSLHPDRVHSDHLLFHAQICSSAASIFTSIRNLSGSAVCAFSKNGGIQVQLWPRAGNCLMYRSLQALCRFRRLHLCLTDCEQSWLFRKVVCMEGDWCFTEVIHCHQSTIMVTGT